MKRIIRKFYSAVLLLLAATILAEDGPLPKFAYEGITLDPTKLAWAPNKDIEHPAIIKMEGLIENPLGKYYLYYAPHKHIGVGLAYSDNINGPWTEYEGNPVLKGPAAPDIRWIKEKKKFYMWAHLKNPQTEMWTSDDGINFKHHSVSITALNVGAKTSTYTRFYEYPLEKYGSKYILLYSALIPKASADDMIGDTYMAVSKDGENWTQLKEPLVKATAEEGRHYCPALFRWNGRNFIVYADDAAWRGGNLKYAEVDQEFNPVGLEGKRFVLMKGPEELTGRLRSPEFIREGNTIHMISGGGKEPRLAVYGKALVQSPGDE